MDGMSYLAEYIVWSMCLFLCISSLSTTRAADVHEAISLTFNFQDHVEFSASENTGTSPNVTTEFGPMVAPELVYAVRIQYSNADIPLSDAFQHRLFFSTCNDGTDYNTFLTLLKAQSDDSSERVNLSEPILYNSNAGDFGCQVEPMTMLASTLVLDVFVVNGTAQEWDDNGDILVFLVVEGFNDDSGIYNLTIRDCGTSCAMFEDAFSCTCSECASGFYFDESIGHCELVPCVAFADHAPQCECMSNYSASDTFGWDFDTSQWAGQCHANCSHTMGASCAYLNRHGCEDVAFTCGTCLEHFFSYEDNSNTIACEPCFDPLCAVCNGTSADACQVCAEGILTDGTCVSACFGVNRTWFEHDLLLMPDDLSSSDYFGQSADINSDFVTVIGSPLNDEMGDSSGAAYVFALNETTGTLSQRVKLVANESASYVHVGAQFGYALKINADGRIIVSAPFDDVDDTPDCGAIYVIDYVLGTNDVTPIAKLTVSDKNTGDQLGAFGLALSDTGVIAAGVPSSGAEHGTFAGAVYIFHDVYATNEYLEVQRVTASDAAAFWFFGSGLDFSGTDDTVLAAGAYGHTDYSGAVYILERVNTTQWEERAILVPDSVANADRCGEHVSIDELTVAFGCSGADNDNGVDAGSVFVFVSAGNLSDWSQEFVFTAENGETNDLFGRQLVLHGSTLMVSTAPVDSVHETVYVYNNVGSSVGWGFERQLVPVDHIPGDKFASEHACLAFSGTRAIVGSYWDDTDMGVDSGSVVIFEVDCQPPIFDQCPGSEFEQIISDDPISIDATVSAYDIEMLLNKTDETRQPIVSCEPALDSIFQVSTSTNVVCRAVDLAGNEETCMFDVTVFPSSEALFITCADTLVQPTTAFSLLTADLLGVDVTTISESYSLHIDVLGPEEPGSSIIEVDVRITDDVLGLEASCPAPRRVETSHKCDIREQPSGVWVMCAPVLTQGSTRIVGVGAASNDTMLPDTKGGQVVLSGEYLDLKDVEMNVMFGDLLSNTDMTSCSPVPDVSNDTSLTVIVPPVDGTWASVQSLRFQISVTSTDANTTLVSLISDDVVHYPVAPSIVSVSGCDESTLKQANEAVGCSTKGGDLITISGLDLVRATSVFVDNIECADLSVENDENDTITCMLPQNDGAGRVVVAYQNTVPSVGVDLVSYATPHIDSVAGCPVNDDRSTFGCPSSEAVEEVVTLIITGSNFGSEGASVFIGTQPSPNVTHGDDPHTMLYAELPAGGGVDNSVLVLQRNGQVGIANASYVSFEECPDGQFSSGSSVCTNCDKGYFTNNATIKSICIPCDRGRYQQETGASACLDCRPGRFSSSFALDYECDSCPVAKFSTGGASECSKCSADTQFAPEEGLASCIDCSPNSIHDAESNEERCICVSNFYESGRDGNNVTCKVCPAGFSCLEPGTTTNSLVLLQGYWRGSDTSEEAVPCLSDIASVCPGGSFGQNDTNVCGTTRTGRLCSVCIPGYVASSVQSACTKCYANEVMLALGIIGLVVLVLGIGTYVSHTLNKMKKHTVDNQKRELTGLIKIIMSAFQLNSIVVSYSFLWSGEFETFMEVEQGVSSAGLSALSVKCIIGDAPGGWPALYVESLVYTLAPFIAFVFAFVFSFAYAWHVWHRLPISGMKERTCKLVAREALKMVRASLLIILYLMHPTLSEQVMVLFHCTDVDGRRMLTEELTERCLNPNAVWLGLSLLGWMLLIPSAAIFFLWKNRQKIKNRNHTFFSQYSFLYRGYDINNPKKSRFLFLWEGVVTLRKVLLRVVMVTAASNAHVQSLVGILVIIIFLGANFYAMPFSSWRLNAAEIASLLNSFVTFYCGQFTFVESGLTENGRQAASVAALISNVLFISLMAFFLYQAYLADKAKNANTDKSGGSISLPMIPTTTTRTFPDPDSKTNVV